MAGLLALETSFAKRKLHLGYRRAEALATTPFGGPGTVLRGHEFHYASILSSEDEPLFSVSDANGTALPPAGGRRGLVTGSFFHVIDGA
jgi:cobyrinic acid a,c-diamide synthase